MKFRSTFLKSAVLLGMLFLWIMLAGTRFTAQAASRVTLVVGETKQLKKTGASAWKSSKRSVVRVSETGEIIALRKGSCKVTAIVNNKKKTWKVSVLAPSLSKTLKKVKVGKTFVLSLKKASKLKFSWSVSDSSVLKLKKKGRNKYNVKGLRNGTAEIRVTRGPYQLVCKVVSGTGVPDNKKDSGKEDSKERIQTLYMDGNVFKEMTWNRSDVAVYISSLSSYGQSAPLYMHKDGGDGLENIWASTNNGAVGVSGAQLTKEAVNATIEKACFWARAVADSPYHGYDYGHGYSGANLMYTFGQAKPNGLGTGDYCCSTIPLCAYYFAGVNVIGENLGGPDAKYIPNSTKLFYEGSKGEITFYENGKLTGARYLSNYEWEIFRACGFTDVVSSYNKNKSKFVFQAGDVVTANGHSQIVLTAGTKKTAETVQAYGHDKVKKGKMPKGGDQKLEIGRAIGVRITKKQPIKHIMRFTGKGVRLNTVGLRP